MCIVYAVAKFELEIPLNERACRIKLRELFMQNKDVTDIRNIDLLVIRVSVKLKKLHFVLNRKSFKLILKFVFFS